MIRNVFIDLEETVIDDWHHGNFLSDNAKRIFKTLQPRDKLSVFSFAIWNKQDAELFDLKFRKPLENFFCRPIVAVPTLFEIKETICKFRRLSIDFCDFSSLFPKHMAFIEFIRATEKCGEFILFDDMVTDWNIQVESKTIKIFKI